MDSRRYDDHDPSVRHRTDSEYSYDELAHRPQPKNKGFLKRLFHPSHRTALKIAWYGSDALIAAGVLTIAIVASTSTLGAALPFSILLICLTGFYLYGSHHLRKQLLP
jgi:hypothetical protein